MNTKRTIEILDALASGFSPITGEAIEADSVLNDREIIRALQRAIDLLQSSSHLGENIINIDESEVKEAIEIFQECKKSSTATNLVGLFLGSRQFKNDKLLAHKLYGKYRDRFSKGQLLDYFDEYLMINNLTPKYAFNDPYKEIDYFKKSKFNNLSEAAVNQLKSKVEALGVQKTDDLSDYIIKARTQHPRAYEVWSDMEKELLAKAIKYTNDLDLLSKCFKRGQGSIESVGQKIIFESQNSMGT